eukprot:6208865-Pleurochrysis_carterae.AAC.1
MNDTLATSMTPSAQLAPVHALSDAQSDVSDPASGKAARRAAQQPTQTKEAPGSKAHLVRYDGNVVSIGNDKFSINTLRHKSGNDVCLPVALSRKANPLAVCDCYGQPGHGELGHGAHKIPSAARAIADAVRLRSKKRISPQPADGERNSQRQRQARANAAAEAQRLGDLIDVVRAVLEPVSIGAPQPGGRGRPTLPSPPHPLFDPSPAPAVPANACSAASAATSRQGERARRGGQRQR